MKEKAIRALRWSERYTKTDMVYFASGNFWLTLSRVVSVGSGMLLTIAFARLLPPETFGTYKYVLAIASFIGAFSLGGLGGSVSRSIAQGNIHTVPGVFRTSILWSLPASFVALAGAVYYIANGNAPLSIGLLLIAITNPFNFGLYKSILIGKKDFKRIAFYNIRGVIPVAIVIATLFLSKNVFVVLIAYFTSNFIVGAIIYLATLKTYGIKNRQEGVKEVVAYGKHLSAMGVISKITDSIDQLLLWHFAGPIQLAIYSFALAPVKEIRNFSENINPLIFPKLITKTVHEMKQTVPLRIMQLLIASASIGILYIWLAPYLYQIIFPQYVDAIFASQLLAAGLIFQPKILVDSMLYVQGDTRLRYTVVIATQCMKVIAWVVLIPTYGFVGAVIGTLISDATSSLIFWWAYKKLK